MEKLLKPEEVSEILGVTPQALAQLRFRGTGPRFQRLSHKTVRYTESAVREFIESSTMSRTDEKVPA